jgi:uncharacterized glyoxalase superfamily protein PhnB
MKNRSVPTDTLLPHIGYENVAEACAWLGRVFGFREAYRYGEPVSGAQMHLGQAYIMVHNLGQDRRTPAQLGYGTQSLTIFVADVDGHYARAKEAGARIVEELHETICGKRQYGAEDLDGHFWLFSQHAKDVSPEAWGATVSTARYSIFGIGVDRKQDVKCLFPQEKDTFQCPEKVYVIPKML